MPARVIDFRTADRVQGDVRPLTRPWGYDRKWPNPVFRYDLDPVGPQVVTSSSLFFLQPTRDSVAAVPAGVLHPAVN